MTCTERANGMGLWNELSDEEKQPINQLELYNIFHEILNERYGSMPDDSADKMFANMRDGEYQLLWMEAVRRLRKRKIVPVQELQVYG